MTPGILVTGIFGIVSTILATISQSYAGSPPVITLPPRNQYVLQNTKATFICEAAGDPYPDIVWIRNRKPISAGRRKYRITNLPNRSILRVIPSGRKDMNITCKAQNGIGRPVIKSAMLKNLEAVPSGFPTITVHPTMRALFEGRDTVMICSADGYPAPTITWLRNDIPVDMGEARFSILPTGGSLHIGKVRESDAGIYECIAENSVGTAYSEPANLFVRVQDLPPTFYIEPESQEVPIGGSVNLTCAAAGRPKPDMLWRKDGEEISATYVHEDGTSVLTLDDLEETANYTCFAFSKVGFAVSSAQITVINTTAIKSITPPSHLQLSIASRQPPRIRVDWDASPLASRFLSGHLVQYRKTAPSTRAEVREAFVPLGSNTFLTDILDYGSLYEVSVTAMRADPTKEPSQPVTSTLLTPTRVTTVSPPLGKALNLTVEDYDCTTGVAILNWLLPENESVVDILHYELWTYTPGRKEDKMIKVQEPDYAVTGLSSREEYIFRVRAVDIRGPGQFSDNITLAKCETPTRPKLIAPKDIRIRRISKTSVEVSWVNPEAGDKNVKGYKILYRLHSDNSQWEFEDVGPTASAILNNLQRDHVYEIRLQAKSQEGYGQVSEAILSPKTSSQVSVGGVIFGKPLVLVARAKRICTMDIRLPRFTDDAARFEYFSVIVLPQPAPDRRADQKPYTAATFGSDQKLPEIFTLGDGKIYGKDVYNRPLLENRRYKVYVKAHTQKRKQVESYYQVSEESEVFSTNQCTLVTQTAHRSSAHRLLFYTTLFVTSILTLTSRDCGT